jgi:hypothetical protein
LCVYYFFLAVVLIRYETTAIARLALLVIVHAFLNDTITVAVWTGFHVRLLEMVPCFANPAVKEKGRPDARPNPHASSTRGRAVGSGRSPRACRNIRMIAAMQQRERKR